MHAQVYCDAHSPTVSRGQRLPKPPQRCTRSCGVNLHNGCGLYGWHRCSCGRCDCAVVLVSRSLVSWQWECAEPDTSLAPKPLTRGLVVDAMLGEVAWVVG
jgi:hypothetical protein